MRDPLAGLDAVGWADLRHAYGSAEDVPVMLRDLYRPEKAARASDDLLTHVHHQGGMVYSSAPPALPYALRAAADPGIDPAVRQELVELVGALAHSGNTARPQHVDPAWPAAWDLAVTELLPDSSRRRRRSAGPWRTPSPRPVTGPTRCSRHCRPGGPWSRTRTSGTNSSTPSAR